MRIGIPSVDAMLVTAGVAAIVLTVGLLDQSSDSGTTQPSGGSAAAEQHPRLPLLVVAADDSPADRAVGRAVADAAGGAVLSIDATGLTEAMIEDLLVNPPAQVLVVGGPSSVSERAAATLRQHTSGSVTRLAGADRFATAALVAQRRFTPPAQHVWIRAGDALAAPVRAAPGQGTHGPVLLVERNHIPESTAAALSGLRPRHITVMGGPGAVSDGVLEQLQRFTSGRVVASS